MDPRNGEAHPFFLVKQEASGSKGWGLRGNRGPKRPLDERFSPEGNALYVVDVVAFAALETVVPLADPFEGTGAVWPIKRQARKRTALLPGLPCLDGRSISRWSSSNLLVQVPGHLQMVP